MQEPITTRLRLMTRMISNRLQSLTVGRENKYLKYSGIIRKRSSPRIANPFTVRKAITESDAIKIETSNS